MRFSPPAGSERANASRRDENEAVGNDLPRMSAMISSVIGTSPPCRRMCSINRSPIVLFLRRARRIRTYWPSKSKSTSVFGMRPAFSRIAIGMVTWPLEVMRIGRILSLAWKKSRWLVNHLVIANQVIGPRRDLPRAGAAACLSPASSRAKKTRTESAEDWRWPRRPRTKTRSSPPALLVIGDEILSGRTKDKNIGYIAEYLTAIGIDLKEVRIVPDEEPEIVAARQRAARAATTTCSPPAASARPTTTSPPTAVAKAFGVSIDYDPRAVEILRVRMASVGGVR